MQIFFSTHTYFTVATCRIKRNEFAVEIDIYRYKRVHIFSHEKRSYEENLTTKKLIAFGNSFPKDRARQERVGA